MSSRETKNTNKWTASSSTLVRLLENVMVLSTRVNDSNVISAASSPGMMGLPAKIQNVSTAGIVNPIPQAIFRSVACPHRICMVCTSAHSARRIFAAICWLV
jgi:hypothetical protein